MKKLTEEQKNFLKRGTRKGVNWKFDSKTGKVIVQGDFVYKYGRSKASKDFEGIKFGVVTGDFYVKGNVTCLKGSPEEVRGNFYCWRNNLESLEGGPKKVGGSVHCQGGKLISLKGAPEIVGGSFYCEDNKLISLKGAPKEVGNVFDCSNNKLTSLEGAPEKVGGSFVCSNNKLTSLKAAPKFIGANFTSDFLTIPKNASLYDWLEGFKRSGGPTLIYSKIKENDD